MLVGLHPPNPIVERLLDRHHLVPLGPFFRVLTKESVPGRVLTDADQPTLLTGEWHGYVLPQGYPVSFSIRAAPDGTFTGRVVLLNEGGSQPSEGAFTRISPIGSSLVARVTYDDRLNIHLDAELQGIDWREPGWSMRRSTCRVVSVPGNSEGPRAFSRTKGTRRRAAGSDSEDRTPERLHIQTSGIPMDRRTPRSTCSISDSESSPPIACSLRSSLGRVVICSHFRTQSLGTPPCPLFRRT